VDKIPSFANRKRDSGVLYHAVGEAFCAIRNLP
jgi:hypothetical protein